MISVTFRIFGSSSTDKIQWGEVREMSVIVIWVESPVSCALTANTIRELLVQPLITRSQVSVSVNLTDDCRELGRNAAETNYRSARVGKRAASQPALAGHDSFEACREQRTVVQKDQTDVRLCVGWARREIESKICDRSVESSGHKSRDRMRLQI